MADEEGLTDGAWRKILDKYPIVETVEAGGIYEIKAAEIKEFREPRLMTKHDTSKLVPEPLRKNDLNVLPISRSAYAISDFKLFEQFPDVTDLRPRLSALPDFETLTVDNITTESNAINALIASGILADFLGADDTVETFNGRMGTGDFWFKVDRKHNAPAIVSVNGAQLEIDGGFENADSVVIMEAKNLPHPDFHVRQLYFPFRKYRALVKKPIRLVFSQFFDQTYYLYEYVFEDPDNYNSIKLINQAAYTFDDRRITSSELWQLYLDTPMRTDDNYERAIVTFPQADRIERIFAIMQELKDKPEGLSAKKIAEFMGTVERQANYYPTAGRWLGVIRDSDDPETRGNKELTPLGRRIANMPHRERKLAIARQLFEHEIFRRTFSTAYTTGAIPLIGQVETWMRELHVINTKSHEMFHRRAQTVLAWTRWLMSLTDEEV